MSLDSYAALERSLLRRTAEILALPDSEAVRITDPPDPSLGDVSVACHPLAGVLRRRPDEIAEGLAEILEREPEVEAASAARGFCNVRFARSALLGAVVHAVGRDGESYGRAEEGTARERWLIEYSGPNTNKPLHIGHLRNTLLGSALAKVVALHGHDVLRYNIVNDRGIHICKSMVAYQRFGDSATPESAGVKGDAFVGSFYSLFARKAAEEFESWTREHGAGALAEFRREHGTSIAAAADLQMRKRFLTDLVAAGEDVGFKPKKVKPTDYPAKMADTGLEDRFQAWRGEREAAFQEAEEAEAVRRFQKAIERRFEAELSELHAASREMLRLWEEENKDVRTLWQTMNTWVLAGFDVTYRRLGVEFDHVDYESEVYLQGKEIVEELIEKGVAHRREDGAVLFTMPSTSPKEPAQEKVLLRADGTSVYITQDLGSLLRRHTRHRPDRLIWVVGAEQELHFQTLFELVNRHTPGLGDRCEHLSYGMVELPHGKMKSREGEIIEADEFLDDVERAAVAQIEERAPDLGSEETARRARVLSLAAVKYHLLKFSKRSTVKFDVEEALDLQGKTGAYCLYALARIRSIRRKWEEGGADWPTLTSDVATAQVPLADEERGLLLQVARFPKAVALAVRDLEPFHVADAVYRLARAFNAYYTASDEAGAIRFPVVGCPDEDVRNARATLLELVARSLENGLAALGIETLDSM